MYFLSDTNVAEFAAAKKKKNNTARNLALGTGAVIALGGAGYGVKKVKPFMRLGKLVKGYNAKVKLGKKPIRTAPSPQVPINLKVETPQADIPVKVAPKPEIKDTVTRFKTKRTKQKLQKFKDDRINIEQARGSSENMTRLYEELRENVMKYRDLTDSKRKPVMKKVNKRMGRDALGRKGRRTLIENYTTLDTRKADLDAVKQLRENRKKIAAKITKEVEKLRTTNIYPDSQEVKRLRKLRKRKQ